jgi:phosphate transport system substrate-binding protein
MNPGVKLPGTDLVVVHRSDGSGTSYIFTDFLSSVSKDWETHVGRNTSVKWPSGLGAKGNEGVAGQVKQLPGTIGYVELAYAHQNKLAVAEIKNSSGNFIAPSLESVSDALASAKVPEDFRFSMVNPPGAKAYPISGATWLLVYQKQQDPAKGKKLVEFLNWAITKGAGMASTLDYASLPAELQTRVLEEVKSITY